LLGGPNLALAGKPSRWGGTAASIAGVAVLVLGLAGALAAWLVLQSIWPAQAFGWAVAIPIAAISMLFGILLLLGGRRLSRSGAARRDEVELQAVRSLVAHRGGSLSAQDVARSLDLSEDRADALLTRLARETATEVTVDVDEAGRVVYDFRGEERRWRVLEDTAAAEEAAASPAQRLRR
jgi:hypothetical protein